MKTQQQVSKKITEETVKSVKLCDDDSVVNGTSLQGYISTSINQMNTLFNTKTPRKSADGKTKHEWYIEITDNEDHKTYITVYDYKVWPQRKDEIWGFHVGAHTKEDADLGISVLTRMFEADPNKN